MGIGEYNRGDGGCENLWPSDLGMRDWISIRLVPKFAGVEAGCVISCDMSVCDSKWVCDYALAVHIDLRMRKHTALR